MLAVILNGFVVTQQPFLLDKVIAALIVVVFAWSVISLVRGWDSSQSFWADVKDLFAREEPWETHLRESRQQARGLTKADIYSDARRRR